MADHAASNCLARLQHKQEGKARQAADAEREVVSLRLRLEYGRDPNL